MSGNDGFVSGGAGGAVKTIQIGALQPASKVKTLSSNESLEYTKFINWREILKNLRNFWFLRKLFRL